jgi:coenzyme PQQ synthesis protein D (PqqD)
VTQLRLNPGAVSWREVDGEVLALDLRRSTYLATNPAGAVLWKSLAAGTSREGLIERLTEEFDVDESRAAADVDDFLGWLVSQGLLAT